MPAETKWSESSLRLLRERLARPLPPRQQIPPAPPDMAKLASRLIPVAAGLTCDVHDRFDAAYLGETLASLSRQELWGLIIVLAAMVDPEAATGDLLGWVTWDAAAPLTVAPEPSRSPSQERRDEYAELREQGYSAERAGRALCVSPRTRERYETAFKERAGEKAA